MPYSREAIPNEDLSLKDKESATQKRYLRPLSDEALAKVNKGSGFGVYHPERENLNKTDFVNEQKIISSNKEEIAVTKEFPISERDVVHLASDSVDFGDLIKPTDKGVLDDNKIASARADQDEIRNHMNRIVLQKTSIPSAVNMDDSRDYNIVSKDIKYNTDSYNIQNNENEISTKTEEKENHNYQVVNKDLELVSTDSYSDSQNKNELKSLNDESEYSGNREQINQKKESLKIFDENKNSKKKIGRINLSTFNIKKSKKDIEILFSKVTREEKIEFIMDLLRTEGAHYAVKIAEKTRDWYILDVIHDKLHLVDKNK